MRSHDDGDTQPCDRHQHIINSYTLFYLYNQIVLHMLLLLQNKIIWLIGMFKNTTEKYFWTGELRT